MLGLSSELLTSLEEDKLKDSILERCEKSMLILSVIIPDYNVENYIEKCIKTILEQKNVDFEVIIIDDGSTDATLEIAKKYESKQVKVFTQKNAGSGEARNYGLSLAQGKYVFFCDPDDSIASNMFSQIFKKINNTDFDVIQFAHSFVSETEKIWPNKKLTLNEEAFLSNTEILRSVSSISNQTAIYAVWSKLISRKFLLDNNLRFSSQKTGEDALFVIEMLKKVNTLLWIPERYYFYLADRLGSAQNKKNYSVLIDDANILEQLYLFQQEKSESSDLYSDFAMYVLVKELRYIDTQNKKYSNFKKTIKTSLLNPHLLKINFKNLSWKRKIFF